MTAAHLRGPEKGLKSYDKICSHLLYTQEFSDYVQGLFHVLDKAHVSGWEFEAGGSDYDDNPLKKKNVAPPKWRLLIDWGVKYDGSPNIEKVYGPQDPMQWLVSTSVYAEEKALDAFAERLWGTPKCPTYFCKLDKLLGVNKKGERVGGDLNVWARAARVKIEQDLCDKISRTQDRLRQEMLTMLRSDEFQKAMTEFHERGIADEIKQVLLKFSSVAKPHVLKMALDEFVTHEIMES
jgi:hypothetical protein